MFEPFSTSIKTPSVEPVQTVVFNLNFYCIKCYPDLLCVAVSAFESKSNQTFQIHSTWSSRKLLKTLKMMELPHLIHTLNRSDTLNKPKKIIGLELQKAIQEPLSVPESCATVIAAKSGCTENFNMTIYKTFGHCCRFSLTISSSSTTLHCPKTSAASCCLVIIFRAALKVSFKALGTFITPGWLYNESTEEAHPAHPQPSFFITKINTI